MSTRSTPGGIFSRGVLLVALGLVIFVVWRAKRARDLIDAGSSSVTVDAAGSVAVGDVQADNAAPGP